MKKNFVLILSLSTMLVISSHVMAASSGNCGTGCSYTLDDDGVLTLSGSGRIYKGNWGNNTNITQIIFDDESNFTAIAENVFQNASNLTNINFPSTMYEISEDAFSGSGLTSITLPQNITSLGNTAFGHMPNLKEVTIENVNCVTINDDAFEGAPEDLIVYYQGGDSAKDVLINMFKSSNWVNGESVPQPVTLKEYDDEGNIIHSLNCYNDGTPLSYTCDDGETVIRYMYDTFDHYSTDCHIIEQQTYTKNGNFYEIDGKKYASFSDYMNGIQYRDLKRIYTVEEATEALGNTGKNTFSIRYR